MGSSLVPAAGEAAAESWHAAKNGRGGGECPGEAPAVMLVSLSGGVDSMVLTHALLRLRRAAAAPFEVHAVHIDYDNRVRRCAARTLDYA